MNKEMDNNSELSVTEKADIILSSRNKEAYKVIDFAKSFRNLSKDLSGAYRVSPDIYSQSASISRSEKGASINEAKEFLNHIEYDLGKAEGVVKDFAKTHKPVRSYFGRDIPINLGINIGSEEILNSGPESKAHGRSLTIAALAQRAARLESLLTSDGIPDAYATAQGQVGRALKVVEKAANLAYDWNPDWGSLNVDNALDHAKNVLTKQKIAKSAIITALALAGCSNTLPPTQTVTPDMVTPQTGEVTPATAEVTPAPTELPTPERPLASGGLYTSEQMLAIEGGKFSDQEQSLADWTKYIWTQGENRAFHPGTTRLNYVYIFDQGDPSSAGVCLESPDYSDVCMWVPIGADGKPLPTPTSVLTSPTIPEGYGPTMLSLVMDTETAKQIDPTNWERLDGSTLGWADNGWVRFKDGKVVATIGETGSWKLSPELVFVPEGFQIGDMGLLRNPETGQDVLTLNPEADWEKIRQDIIGGLWEANVDWAKFTGQGNDATSYTKEQFIQDALDGKVFHIGIPVRINMKILPEGTPPFTRVVFRMVDVRLDNIRIQVMDPVSFKEYTGKDWTDDKQEAYSCTVGADRADGTRVILFSTDGNGLVISVGNFSSKNEIADGGKLTTIGHFDPTLYEKRPTYFRPDGIGVEANLAVSFTLEEAIGALRYFSEAHSTLSGTNIKNVSSPIAADASPNPDYTLTPPFFIFNP